MGGDASGLEQAREQPKSESTYSSRTMKVLSLILGVCFGTASIGGLIYDSGDGTLWVLTYVAMLVFAVVLILGALRLQFKINEGGIHYRGFVSNTHLPIAELTGVFVEPYPLSMGKGTWFFQVIVIQGDFGERQLDGTAGRAKKVEGIKQAIVACLPADHPQRKRVGRGPGGAHRRYDRN